jgi:hypothetical protein
VGGGRRTAQGLLIGETQTIRAGVSPSSPADGRRRPPGLTCRPKASLMLRLQPWMLPAPRGG